MTKRRPATMETRLNVALKLADELKAERDKAADGLIEAVARENITAYVTASEALFELAHTHFPKAAQQIEFQRRACLGRVAERCDAEDEAIAKRHAEALTKLEKGDA